MAKKPMGSMVAFCCMESRRVGVSGSWRRDSEASSRRGLLTSVVSQC